MRSHLIIKGDLIKGSPYGVGSIVRKGGRVCIFWKSFCISVSPEARVPFQGLNAKSPATLSMYPDAILTYERPGPPLISS